MRPPASQCCGERAYSAHYEAPFAIGLTCSLPFCHRASAKRKNMVGMARPKKQKVEVAETVGDVGDG